MEMSPWLRLQNCLLLLQLWMGGYVRKLVIWIIKENRKVFQTGHYLRLLIDKNKRLLRKVERKWKQKPFVAWFVGENRKLLLSLTRWGFTSHQGGFFTPDLKCIVENPRDDVVDDGYETEDELEQYWRTESLEEARRTWPWETLVRAYRQRSKMVRRRLEVLNSVFEKVFLVYMLVVAIWNLKKEGRFFSDASPFTLEPSQIVCRDNVQ